MTPQEALDKIRASLEQLSWVEWAPEGTTKGERQRYTDTARARTLDRLDSIVREVDSEVSA